MRTRGWIVGGTLALMAAVAPQPGAAQGQAEEAVMTAAAEWARERLPQGALRVDPHRTGQGVGQGVAQRVARALGADLGTLEETRSCTDPLDASTCTLQTAALLAISAPRIDGDRATVRVYAWHRQSRPREPVAKRSWDLELRRTAGGWQVAGGG